MKHLFKVTMAIALSLALLLTSVPAAFAVPAEQEWQVVLNYPTIAIAAGQDVTTIDAHLVFEAVAADNIDEEFQWVSSDPSVAYARADEVGEMHIYGNKQGTTTITVTSLEYPEAIAATLEVYVTATKASYSIAGDTSPMLGVKSDYTVTKTGVNYVGLVEVSSNLTTNLTPCTVPGFTKWLQLDIGTTTIEVTPTDIGPGYIKIISESREEFIFNLNVESADIKSIAIETIEGFEGGLVVNTRNNVREIMVADSSDDALPYFLANYSLTPDNGEATLADVIVTSSNEAVVRQATAKELEDASLSLVRGQVGLKIIGSGDTTLTIAAKSDPTVKASVTLSVYLSSVQNIVLTSANRDNDAVRGKLNSYYISLGMTQEQLKIWERDYPTDPAKTDVVYKVYDIKATVNPLNATLKSLKVKSSDTTVAAFSNANGTALLSVSEIDIMDGDTFYLTFVGAGIATVTVTATDNGGNSVVCVLDVTVNVEEKTADSKMFIATAAEYATYLDYTVDATTGDRLWKVKRPIATPTEAVKANFSEKDTTVEKLAPLYAIVDTTGKAMSAVTWESSNKKVATIDKDTGVVTVKGVGTTTITCTTKYATKTVATRTLIVTSDVAATKVVIKRAGFVKTEDTLIMKYEDLFQTKTTNGKPVQYTGHVDGEKASSKKLEWSSSDETVAIVDKTGLVRAVGFGTTIITATSVNTEVFATVKLTVAPKLVKTIIVNEGKNELHMVARFAYVRETGETTVTLKHLLKKALVEKINASSNNAEGKETVKITDKTYLDIVIKPARAYYQGLTFTSGNPAIAKVNENGRIVAMSSGHCQITVAATDGSGVKSVIEVYVTEDIAGTQKLPVLDENPTGIVNTHN